MKKRLIASIGAVALTAVLSTPMAFADTHASLVQSNAVKVTGGYTESYQTQQYQQTGTTTQSVQVQTGGGYYDSRTVQSGSHQECTTTYTVTNHATYYATFYPWQWNNGNPIDAHYGPPGHYGAPYWNTYDPVTSCSTVPDYTTQTYWVPPTYGWTTRTVPVYGWVTVTQTRWHPAQVDNGN